MTKIHYKLTLLQKIKRYKHPSRQTKNNRKSNHSHKPNHYVHYFHLF